MVTLILELFICQWFGLVYLKQKAEFLLGSVKHWRSTVGKLWHRVLAMFISQSDRILWYWCMITRVRTGGTGSIPAGWTRQAVSYQVKKQTPNFKGSNAVNVCSSIGISFGQCVFPTGKGLGTCPSSILGWGHCFTMWKGRLRIHIHQRILFFKFIFNFYWKF